MGEIKITRDFFLWCMSVIYLCAFSSLYYQIPGLYGENGILPVSSVIALESGTAQVEKKAKELPSLLWLAPSFGLDVPTFMEFLSIVGMLVSFGGMIWVRLRDCANFGLLWILYFSLYQGGQTFLWFQWDILLLEAGFLTVITAPLGLLQWSKSNTAFSGLPHRPHDTVTFWLIRWLLFRLMFASGIVKLTSLCPTWWGLTALSIHFESQCIPTALAWFCHHLPGWLLKLAVAVTLVIEIGVPFLFFIPLRSAKIFSFYSQVLLQFCIILSGNYNFFNLLTIVLCLSLVDDEFLLNLVGKPSINKATSYSGRSLQFTRMLLTFCAELIIFGGLMYWSVNLFSIQLLPDWTIFSKVAFTAKDFELALKKMMPVTICFGALSLVMNILAAVYRCLTSSGHFRKVFYMVGVIFWGGVSLWLFAVSLVPHTVVDKQSYQTLWPIIHRWNSKVDKFQIANSYGLFRRMTGVGGRPEVVIEGSNSKTSGWKEYHFLYKPGDMSIRPPFIIPHQPRLDWQLWFAALGSYNQNPWFLSLVYRLLQGQPEVLNLLHKERNPFPTQPPKYIRAVLYKYFYTPWELSKRRTNVNNWWTRKKVGEYLPPVTMGRALVDTLKSVNIPVEKTRSVKITNTFLFNILWHLKEIAQKVYGHTFVWSVIGTGLVISSCSALLAI